MSSKMRFRMKMALYVVVLFAAMLLDEAVFGAMNLRYRPCVMPIAVACIGLWEGIEKGSIFGLVGGCLWAWSGPLSLMGAWHIVALTLVGFASGLLAQRFLLQSWKTIFSISIPALLLTEGVYVVALTARGVLPGSVIITDLVPAVCRILRCFLSHYAIYFPDWRIPWIEPIAFATALSYS